ncbi:putative efflux transporter [Dendrothele bispora CBS 962.96]|uniref:Putative efflux transporter n=1 Tax=Dendrothele bispora (strain CBS 962.96) TaxID=1314807 RepID=A0A4S8LWL5_DENBC|nr:putative efflux transporter [Dendrothele bispora CBS 962.96]
MVEKAPLHATRTANIDRPPQRSLWSSICIIGTCTLAMIASIVNNTTVSVALPTMQHDLHIEQVTLQWVVSGYALSSACLLLLFGRLADLYGRKKTFVVGSIWLIAFTLGCAFAFDPLVLDVLRGFQGVGAAATIPASIGTLAHSFPPSKARAVAFSTFAAGAPLGGALGFALGGCLTELTKQTWRAPFYLCSALTFVSLVGAMYSFDADEPSTEPDQRVDWIGAFLVTAGLVLIIFVLGQGEVAVPSQWATPYIIVLLILGVAFTTLFLVWQHHLECIHDIPPPLMKISLWTRAKGKVAAVMSIAFLNWCCFMGFNYWCGLYYQNFLQLSPLDTVARLSPMFVTGVICNVIVAIFANRVPMVILVVIGTSLTSTAALLFALINPNVTYWAFGFPAAIISVFGADFVFAPGTMYIASVSAPHEQSVAGATFQTITQLGTSLGVAVSTVVFNRVEMHQMLKYPPGSNSDLNRDIRLPAYHAAEWSNFAFGVLATIIGLIFLRGIGVIGHRTPPKAGPDTEAPSANRKT